MAHQDETKIVEASKERLRNLSDVHPPQIQASGISMDAYQFLDDSKPFKTGHIFHANKLERIQFGLRSRQFKVEESTGKETARFLVSDNEQLSTMENVMKLGFILKHVGILKPIFVTQNPQVVAQNSQVGAQNPQVGAQNPQIGAQNLQLCKVVSGFGWFDLSFRDWLANRTPQTGTFLYESEKQMLRTAYAAIDEMWRSGYTCDTLADPDSYVMTGSRIKLLSHLCRLKDDHDIDFMPLRNALASLLENHIRPLWIVPGLEEFILLLQNPVARKIEDIFGHPILLKPGRRRLMYRTLTSRAMSQNRIGVLQRKIPFSPNWKIIAPHTDEVLQSIIGTNGPFSQDVDGALSFADMVSKHYVQHFKRLKGADWYKQYQDDAVDESLSESVPGLLSKRYALNFDDEFLES